MCVGGGKGVILYSFLEEVAFEVNSEGRCE